MVVMITIISSCAPIVSRHRMVIGHETILCPDSIRATCMLVKIDTASQWMAWPMTKEIYGFTYQSGFKYELAVEEVRKRGKNTLPWWRVVEVMTKEEFTMERPKVYGTNWRLTAYGDDAERQTPVEGAEVTLEFSEYGSISGKSGCNRYFAECSFPGTNRIKVANPGSTRMMCMDPEGLMELEQTYLRLLTQSVSYEMNRESLTIQCQNDRILIFEKWEK